MLKMALQANFYALTVHKKLNNVTSSVKKKRCAGTFCHKKIHLFFEGEHYTLDKVLRSAAN